MVQPQHFAANQNKFIWNTQHLLWRQEVTFRCVAFRRVCAGRVIKWKDWNGAPFSWINPLVRNLLVLNISTGNQAGNKKKKNIYPEVKKIFWHVIDKCEMISDMYNLVTCIFPVQIKFFILMARTNPKQFSSTPTYSCQIHCLITFCHSGHFHTCVFCSVFGTVFVNRDWNKHREKLQWEDLFRFHVLDPLLPTDTEYTDQTIALWMWPYLEFITHAVSFPAHL